MAATWDFCLGSRGYDGASGQTSMGGDSLEGMDWCTPGQRRRARDWCAMPSLHWLPRAHARTPASPDLDATWGRGGDEAGAGALHGWPEMGAARGAAVRMRLEGERRGERREGRAHTWNRHSQGRLLLLRDLDLGGRRRVM
jgi:hypothetical protein